MTTIGLRDLKGRPVMDLSTATTVGVVASGVLDPGTDGVEHLVLDRAGSTNLLPWEAIQSIGPDAVTVASAAVLVGPDGPAEERAAGGDVDPLGKPLFTDQGQRLGTVADVIIDASDGGVVGMDFGGSPDERFALVGAGAYAVVARRI